jgi:hypothetical protein
VYKNQIKDFKNQLKDINTINDNDIKMKVQLKEKDLELITLKNENEDNKNKLEKLNKINEAMKNQLIGKESEIDRFKKLNEEATEENEKLLDENMKLKKENNEIKMNIKINEAGKKNEETAKIFRIENELKNSNQKNKELEEEVNKCKDKIRKKSKILDSKKEMNLLLVEILQLQKKEIECMKNINSSGGEKLKEILDNLKSASLKRLKDLERVVEEDKELDDDDDEDEDEEYEDEDEEDEEGNEDDDEN